MVSPFRTERFPPGLERGFLMLVLSFHFSFRFFASGLSTIPASQGFGWRHVIESGARWQRQRRSFIPAWGNAPGIVAVHHRQR